MNRLIDIGLFFLTCGFCYLSGHEHGVIDGIKWCDKRQHYDNVVMVVDVAIDRALAHNYTVELPK